MLIRPADTDDVAGLVSLFEEWGHPLSSVDVLAVLAEWGSTARGEVLVAVVDGEIAGMVAVSAGPRFAGPGRYGHLSGLAVAANHRRRGVGTALLKGAEGSVYAWGCDRLELTSSRSRTAAHNFYRRHGYEETADHHARYVRLFDRDLSSPMTEIAPKHDLVERTRAGANIGSHDGRGRTGASSTAGWDGRSGRHRPRRRVSSAQERCVCLTSAEVGPVVDMAGVMAHRLRPGGCIDASLADGYHLVKPEVGSCSVVNFMKVYARAVGEVGQPGQGGKRKGLIPDFDCAGGRHRAARGRGAVAESSTR